MSYSYSVEKRKTKTKGIVYDVRFRIINKEGYEIHKRLSGYSTSANAKKAYMNFMAEYVPPNIPKNVMTFKQLYLLYKDNILKKLSPNSIYSHIKISEKHILPYFNKQPINTITRGQITSWQDNFLNYSNNYRKSIRSVLSAIFTFAMNREFVNENPVSKSEKIKKNEQHSKIQYWNENEFEQFISVVDNFELKVYFLLSYLSCCRKGELFALKWSDIHPNEKYISITKTYTKKGLYIFKNYGVKRKASTKNKKNGDVYLPQDMINLLLELKKNKNGKINDYVFGKNNKPLSETTLTRKFNYYIEKANVKKIRIHDLRHSGASLIISTGESEISILYAIANKLRDSPEQILKTYGHLFPSRQKEILEKVEENENIKRIFDNTKCNKNKYVCTKNVPKNK